MYRFILLLVSMALANSPLKDTVLSQTLHSPPQPHNLQCRALGSNQGFVTALTFLKSLQNLSELSCFRTNKHGEAQLDDIGFAIPLLYHYHVLHLFLHALSIGTR